MMSEIHYASVRSGHERPDEALYVTARRVVIGTVSHECPRCAANRQSCISKRTCWRLRAGLLQIKLKPRKVLEEECRVVVDVHAHLCIGVVARLVELTQHAAVEILRKVGNGFVEPG